jgi:hypothetical protein
LPVPRPYPPDGQGGTFPYDGGPANPVPLPKNNEPMKLTPGDGRLVYIPSTPVAAFRGSSGFAYPAYGESQPASTFGTDRLAVTTTTRK